MNNRRKELMLASAKEYCKCVVEGKTIKYNQLFTSQSFSSSTEGNILYTKQDDYTWILSGTANAVGTKSIFSGALLTIGHKYVLTNLLKNNNLAINYYVLLHPKE